MCIPTGQSYIEGFYKVPELSELKKMKFPPGMPSLLGKRILQRQNRIGEIICVGEFRDYRQSGEEETDIEDIQDDFTGKVGNDALKYE